MDLTPELLRTVEFNDAKKGGYDHDEVDEFLDRAAADLARQHGQIRDFEARITDAERRATEAEEASRDHSDSDETLRRTLVLAQRTADAAIKEAQDDAARIVAEARHKADGMIASAEEQVRREVGATRDRLQAEIRELEARRAQLHERITDLGGHLDTERERIGAQLDELRASLGSDSMRMADVPGADVPGADEPSLFDATARGASADRSPSLDEQDLDTTDSAPTDSAAGDDGDDPDGDADDDLSELPPPPADWTPGDDDAAPIDSDLPADDGGPPTQATPVVDVTSDVGSSHLDELRRAVSDGPPADEDDDAAMAVFFDQDDDEDAEPSRRFGRRR